MKSRFLSSVRLWNIGLVAFVLFATQTTLSTQAAAGAGDEANSQAPIFARQFEEPLIATAPTSRTEDQVLLEAISTYQKQENQDDLQVFEDFLSTHPKSGWRVALLTNLGLSYYHNGYFSRAIAAFEQAWREGRGATEPHAKALVDRAVGELARMHARIGHADELEMLFADIGARPISGPATELITGAHEGAWMMRHDYGTAYLCGPQALKNMLLALNANSKSSAFLDDARSGPHGFSLQQVADLATKLNQPYRLIYRAPGQSVPVPSVINWKINHYAAIVGKEHGRYHVKDPTFGGDLLISQAAIDAESSGYFLVPADSPPDEDWRAATADEAQEVYGMGFTSVSQPGATTPDDKTLTAPPTVNPPTEKTTCPMCAINAHTMTVSLNLNDTPVGYRPKKGPPVYVRLTYNQREAGQPANFSFFNVSPKWTLNVLSYIQDSPTLPGNSVTRYVAGGGFITYPVPGTGSYNSSTGAFPPEKQTQAVLVRIPGTGAVTSYELRFPDGSKQVFARADGATTFPRRIFLTQIIDPAGNSLTLNYDSQLRLTSITDAGNRNTTFAYGLTSLPMLVTQITDPFGRAATLTYDANGHLASITDILGLTSSFAYDSAGLVNALTTPYGTSHFVYGQNTSQNSRFLEITDPLGFTERLEFFHLAPGIPYAESAAPTGMGGQNEFLYYRNSFLWDKHVYPITHTDYTKARITHWLHNSVDQTSPLVESIQPPLENRIWYNYAGVSSIREGATGTPTTIGRVLDDGSSQLTRLTYNPIGRPTQVTDPLGRVTNLDYAANNIDILAIRQKTSAVGTSTIATFTYNSQHLPLTSTDAAGQTTTYTYNSAGQLLTATNPLGQTTRYAYDGLGRLTTITNANGAIQASLIYDAFDRVATQTDSEGYVVSYQYDNLDRVTQISYPDGTTTRNTYDKLDLASVKDRLGRATTYAYDANRRLTSVRDALGQTTQYDYYKNGVLRSITDPKGNVTSWDIDIESRPVAKHYADGKTETYAYENATARLKSTTDALSQIKRYTYANDNNVSGISYTGAVNPTPNVAFSYDPFFPRRVSMTDGSGTTRYTYQPVGSPGALQLLQEDGPYQNDTIAYQYDALGRASSRTVDTSVETFSYDSLGRPTSHASALGTFDLSYLGQTGQLTGRHIQGGTLGTDWTYDTNTNDRRLTTIANSGATRGYQYTRTPENIISRITEAAPAGSAFPPRTWDFAYDNVDRLIGASSSGGPQYTYSYDPADNILSSQGPTGTKNGSYNADNQVVSFGGLSYVYDGAGNVLDDGVRTYKWDAENRLVGITHKAQPARTTIFRYDGLGRRIAIVTSGVETRYLWCGDAICQARGATDVVSRRYFPEGEIIPAGGTLLYYAQDHLGSVRDVLAVQNGSRVAAYDYDPYGNPSQTAGRVSTDFRYAGMFYIQQDGLYLTNYRAYDPKTGRWLSRDPIGEAAGTNLYAYVGNDPVNRADPLGLFPCDERESWSWPWELKQLNQRRNLYNDAPSTVRQALHRKLKESGPSPDMIMSSSEVWIHLLGAAPDKYHTQGNGNGGNIKIVFENGSEGVYDWRTGNLVTDPVNMGTYNYSNPSGFRGVVGHFYYDVLPYYVYGNPE